ncbi:hypothetical protein [Paraburkholderia sp. BR10882]|uniref:hypothetical protein n=1 Tax=unclassified Paraburkholderia TaxID=2615204 RepID=UPI0034CF9652
MLAEFIDRLPGRSATADVGLVIAGDIVDFLAEETWLAFTSDPNAACAKLRRILDDTAPIWASLRRFVEQRDGALTLMLGNHDIEISLPASRQLLRERLGGGRIDFIFDNEALSVGPVLIEHGNRFDEWNAVPHGALRRVRSQLSRGLPVQPEFPALPGSRLVVDVMNPLKRQYAFVDLLKPEDAGALPILAALGAGGIRDAWKFFQRFRDACRVDYDETREPLSAEYIGAGDQSDEEMFDLAMEIENGGDASQINAIGDAMRAASSAVSNLDRKVRRDALFKAIRGRASRLLGAFEVDKEDDKYLTPARTAADAGFKVVVYGHTHLVKRVRLGDAASDWPVYLNTGTWADLMRMPDAVWAPDESHALNALTRFIADLESGALDDWRRAVPTYAKIEIDGETLIDADVYFADGAGAERVSTDALLQRLAGGAPHD